MASYDAGAASNMLYGYAYEGVWEKYNEPFLRRWIWTLTPSKAIFVLGAYALLLTFTQSRTWLVVRHVVLSRNKTVRLDGGSQPDPLEHLSQANALKDIFPLIVARSRLWRRSISRRRPNSTDYTVEADAPIISPWFGICAIMNIGIFSVLGVALPVGFSDGVLGAPIVKSKLTTDCSNFYRLGDQETTFLREQQVRTDAVFDICLDRLNMGCSSQYYFQQPQISRSRTPCPFPWNICQNDTGAFSLTHSDITARELGVNSKSTISMNHRLTCSPVHLDPFLVLDLPRPGQILLSVQQNQSKLVWNQFTMVLHTRNGPNSFSHERSGQLVSLDKSSTRDFTVLPRQSSWLVRKSSDDPKSQPFQIHNALQHDYGASFLAILRPAGRGSQPEIIDDPFFSAHDEYVSEMGRKLYYPDFEATALGCLEQFQLCTSMKGNCTNWSEPEKLIWEAEVLLKEDLYSLAELGMLFSAIPSAISVADYLRDRMYTTIPLTKSAPWMDDFGIGLRGSKEQWLVEVEVWFMKGILSSILSTENGARIARWRKWENDYPGNYNSEHSLCNRILFRDAGYTNINLVGFWTTVGLFTLICLVSYGVKSLDGKATMIWETLKRTFGLLLMRSVFWKVLLFFRHLANMKWIAATRGQLREMISELQYVERFPASTVRGGEQSERADTHHETENGSQIGYASPRN